MSLLAPTTDPVLAHGATLAGAAQQATPVCEHQGRSDPQILVGPSTSGDCRGLSALLWCLPLCMLASWIALLVGGNGQVDRLGNPIGADFAMFYIAGQTASQGDWSRLYDEADQQRRLLQLFPNLPVDAYLPYRYPPLLAALLAPLGWLPYWVAFALFTMATVSAWAVAWWTLFRTCLPQADPMLSRIAYGLVAAPVIVQTLIDGQASAWWFALAAGCWCCLQRQRWVAAGCLLAMASCKPNVMLLLGVVLVVRYPKLLLGLIPAAVAIAAATWSIAGGDCLSAYVELGQRLATQPWQVETPYWKVQSLISWTQLVLGNSARPVNLVLGLCSAVAIGAWWRHRPQHDELASVQALAGGLLVNALFNPYLPVYDLTLLCLGAFVCLAFGARYGQLSTWLDRRDVQLSLILIWIGPILSQAISKATQCPQQLMPVGLLSLGLYWLCACLLSKRIHASCSTHSMRSHATNCL